MAIVNADVTNKSGSGARRGGIYFPPFVKEKPVSVLNIQWIEIQACEVLETSNVDVQAELADVSVILPDGMNSSLAVTDTEETTEEDGMSGGVSTGGGGNSGALHDEEAQVPASKNARDYAKEQGVSLSDVADNGPPSGAAGLYLKSDVKAYEEGTNANQPEEEHSDSSRTAETDAEGGNQGINIQSREEPTGPQDSNAEGSANEDGGGK